MSVVDDLRAVRELLSEPERWTKRAYARGISGGSVYATEDATCWCILGACEEVTGGGSGMLRPGNPLYDALKCWTVEPVTTWNDDPSRTHAEVLALLDAAIEAESKKEGAAKWV